MTAEDIVFGIFGLLMLSLTAVVVVVALGWLFGFITVSIH